MRKLQHVARRGRSLQLLLQRSHVGMRCADKPLRSDTAIAEAAVSALKSSVAVPADDVKVVVREGWITLEGKVAFQYQKLRLL